MSKKLAGKKITDSHSTIISEAYALVQCAEKLDQVTKISLGIIRPCSGGRGKIFLKIKDTQSGLEAIIRGNSSVQTIYLYLRAIDDYSRARVKNELKSAFESKRKYPKI